MYGFVSTVFRYSMDRDSVLSVDSFLSLLPQTRVSQLDETPEEIVKRYQQAALRKGKVTSAYLHTVNIGILRPMLEVGFSLDMNVAIFRAWRKLRDILTSTAHMHTHVVVVVVVDDDDDDFF